MNKAGMKKGTTQSKISSTEDGLHLDGSILWFDAHHSGELSFLSSADFFNTARVPRVIATEETIKILEAKRKTVNALVCQYNRPFSIGSLKMELLPSGSVLGGASLYVENDKDRILYAPYLQTDKNPTVRQMQLKKANTLIISSIHPDPNVSLPNRKKEKERLLATIKEFAAKKIYPVVLAKSIATAQEITQLLTDHSIPLAVHSTIYKINRIYEIYGVKLGRYSSYSSRHTKNKVMLFPLVEQDHLRLPLPEGPILYIEDTMEPSMDPTTFRSVDDRFYISSTCDGKDLKEVITAVAPKEIYVFGPYAKRYCDEFKNIGRDIKPLYSNDQPTLL